MGGGLVLSDSGRGKDSDDCHHHLGLLKVGLRGQWVEGSGIGISIF